MLRLLTAAVLAVIAARSGASAPAIAGVLAGIGIWLVLTSRGDLAPPAGPASDRQVAAWQAQARRAGRLPAPPQRKLSARVRAMSRALLAATSLRDGATATWLFTPPRQKRRHLPGEAGGTSRPLCRTTGR